MAHPDFDKSVNPTSHEGQVMPTTTCPSDLQSFLRHWSVCKCSRSSDEKSNFSLVEYVDISRSLPNYWPAATLAPFPPTLSAAAAVAAVAAKLYSRVNFCGRKTNTISPPFSNFRETSNTLWTSIFFSFETISTSKEFWWWLGLIVDCLEETRIWAPHD